MAPTRAKTLAKVTLIWLGLATVCRPAQGIQPSSPGPLLTAQEATKQFTLAPGLRIDLVADDAVIHHPLAMQFSADGRLWVLAIDGRSPASQAGKDTGTGCVVVLEDTDGDGRMDKRTTFAAGFFAPCGLLLVRHGALVMDPPRLWFLGDRDGDTISDEKRLIATDVSERPNQKPGFNGLLRALDNWIYGAASTERIRAVNSGGFERDLAARRAGRSVTQDESGRLYYGGDANVLQMERISSAYLWRNLGFRAAPALVPMPITMPNRGADNVALAAHEKSERPPADWMIGDAMIYRGTLFGAEFGENVLVSEPAMNRISRCPLPSDRSAAVISGAGEAKLILHSTDAHFRPVSLAQGPDGALYIADSYGAGPAPISYPRSGGGQTGPTHAAQAGRIWRIAPAHYGVNAKWALPDDSTAKLVRTLGDVNGWQRDTAQRLLIEQGYPSASALIREFALTSPHPLGRVHALWTLEGLDELDQDTALRALDDRDPRVCSAAIRLAEKFLYPVADPSILAQLIRLANHPEPMVTLQLALSLGEAGRPEADAIMRDLLIHSNDRSGLSDAVVSGIGGRESDFIAALAAALPTKTNLLMQAVADATRAALVTHELTRMMFTPEDRARMTRLFALAVDPAISGWIRAAMLDGLEQHIPRAADNRMLSVTLPAVPTALISFAARSAGSEAEQVRRLLRVLNWPGKTTPVESQAARLTPAEKARFEKGRAAFPVTCAACHQPQGQGLPGLAPPLAGSRWIQGDERIVARIVLCGKIQGAFHMPTLRGSFDDETIAAVLTFVRNSWGNAAGAVSPVVVTEARASTINRAPMPFTDVELIELAQEFARFQP